MSDKKGEVGVLGPQKHLRLLRQTERHRAEAGEIRGDEFEDVEDAADMEEEMEIVEDRGGVSAAAATAQESRAAVPAAVSAAVSAGTTLGTARRFQRSAE